MLAEVAGLDVKQLLMGAASTLASLAYAKLERKDLAQAKLAIDGVSALLPLLDGDLQRDLAQALAGRERGAIADFLHRRHQRERQ